jgi:hypothetical protein
MLTEPTVLTPRGISDYDPKSAEAFSVTTENAVEAFVKGLPTRRLAEYHRPCQGRREGRANYKRTGVGYD